MITKDHIWNLAEEALLNPEHFVVEVSVDAKNNIKVELDGDKGILIADCIKVSRHIESSFDREKEDFALEVSSAGLEKPLRNNRQYKKNEGRQLRVHHVDGDTIEGKLLSTNDNEIRIQKKTKKEMTVVEIPFSEIEKAFIIVSFK